MTEPAPHDPVLSCRDIELSFGGLRALKGLSFDIAPGEIFGLVGPNGSGKTSLLRILCGLLTPGAGEVRWQGQPIRSLREEFSRSVVFLGHAPAIKDELTARENLEVSCVLAGLSVSATEIEHAVGRFGVPAGKAVRQLSQGQRRRAALARLALSAGVPLWLLDEPFTALDAAASATVEELMRSHAAGGGAVVYTTHHAAGLGEARVLEL
jgi:heme exporter protein A